MFWQLAINQIIPECSIYRLQLFSLHNIIFLHMKSLQHSIWFQWREHKHEFITTTRDPIHQLLLYGNEAYSLGIRAVGENKIDFLVIHAYEHVACTN